MAKLKSCICLESVVGAQAEERIYQCLAKIFEVLIMLYCSVSLFLSLVPMEMVLSAYYNGLAICTYGYFYLKCYSQKSS